MGYKHKKEDIITIGSELIRKKGYHNVGINEILKACAIPKGSFYNFFSSKEDFIEQSLKEYGQRSLRVIQMHLGDSNKSPLKRLKDFYAFLLDMNAQEGCNAGCLVNNISMELGGLNPSIAAVADEQFQETIATIALCVQEGQEAGEISTKFSAMYIAEYIHAGIGGAFSRMKVQNNRNYLDKWHAMTFDFIAV